MEQAGRLEVPTIFVGERTITGFNRQLLEEELTEAGYPSGDASTVASSDDGEDLEETAEISDDDRNIS